MVTKAVWLEPPEAERIRAAAARAGLSQTAWMRRQLLRGIPAPRREEERDARRHLARVSTEHLKRKSKRDPAEGSCETQLQNCRELAASWPRVGRELAASWPRVGRELAAKLGAKVVHEFKDEGISGDAKDRREYMAMLASAERGDFNLILANEQSRRWRNEAETHRCVEDLAFREIRIVTRDGYDSTNAAAGCLLTIKARQNTDAIKETSVHVTDELTKMAKAGKLVGGCPCGYRHKAIADGTHLDRHGNAVVLEVRREPHPEQAPRVSRIFKDFAAGASGLHIARALNAEQVPSPGSTWEGRSVRRCNGWTASAVYGIPQNEMYIGRYIWNRHRWKKVAPGSKKRKAIERRRHEWIITQMPQLRLICDALWAKTRARGGARRRQENVSRSGGKARYLLSGLLKCSCGANFVLDNKTHYRCGTYLAGDCKIGLRLEKDLAQDLIRGPIKRNLLDPAVVELMAKEMQGYYAERMAAMQKRNADRPAEQVELEARIARIRGRLKNGDPDMSADELQAARDRAEAKRTELLAAQPTAKASAKIVTMLPRAAEAYRRQIEAGLDRDPARRPGAGRP